MVIAVVVIVVVVIVVVGIVVVVVAVNLWKRRTCDRFDQVSFHVSVESRVA